MNLPKPKGSSARTMPPCWSGWGRGSTWSSATIGTSSSPPRRTCCWQTRSWQRHPPHRQRNSMRIGHGYDVHRLVPGRKLILGGVDIPHETGLLGHSDADVLLHAICDAILGAIAAGDIGRHFPDSDPAYKGADSIKLLRHVMDLA